MRSTTDWESFDMSDTDSAVAVPTPPAVAVPDGFFDEIASFLESESASDVAEAVIEVCTRRGILHPELEQEPDAELRAEEMREVFDLLERVTAAVADGTIEPKRVRDDEFDPDMAKLWEQFTEEAVDTETGDEVAAMLNTGKPGVSA